MRALLSVLALLALTACSLVDAQVRIAVPWVAPDQQSLQEGHPTPPGPAPVA